MCFCRRPNLCVANSIVAGDGIRHLISITIIVIIIKRFEAYYDSDLDSSGQAGPPYRTWHRLHRVLHGTDVTALLSNVVDSRNGGRIFIAVVKETVYDVKVALNDVFTIFCLGRGRHYVGITHYALRRPAFTSSDISIVHIFICPIPNL